MRLPGLSVLLIAGVPACGWFDGHDETGEVIEARKRGQRVLPDGEAPVRARPAVPPAERYGGSPRPVPEAIADGPTVAELEEGEPGLVVFAVLDTVRADHLEVCGYDRPTSPVFKTLLGMGSSLTCEAYSPGTWTLPSHATFFTGLPTDDHDLHRKGVRLPDEATTLAEVFESRGYQTLLISANPVIKEATGLHQGFQRARNSMGLVNPYRGDGIAQALRQELATLDRSRPLFVFLNIFDAHDPYPPIPEGVGWVPERPAFVFRPHDKTPDNPYFSFIEGLMSDEARAEWLAHATDTYDFGIATADRSLGRMLRMLERQGWIDHGARLVVASDHGEHLGEHDLVRHDGPPWQGVTRVPFVYFDSARDTPLELPEPFPTEVTFHLLTEGALPEPMPTPKAVSVRYGNPDRRYVDGVALWPGPADKLMWMGGTSKRFDLDADPAEIMPAPVGDHPAAPALEAAVQAHLAAKERALTREVDEGMVEELTELGYLDE